MAKKRKSTKKTVSGLARKMQIAGTEFDRRVKLTPDEKIEIRNLRCDGRSYYSLAKEYNVHHKTIMRVCDTDRYPQLKTKYDPEKAKVNFKNIITYKKKLIAFGKVDLKNIVEKGIDKEFETKFEF
jgi:IS30 family transposase